MLVLLIIDFALFSSSALVQVEATAVEDVFGIAHIIRLLSISAGGYSFWYRPFSNFGAFIRPRIGLTAIFVDLIRVFFGQSAAWRGCDTGVRRTSA